MNNFNQQHNSSIVVALVVALLVGGGVYYFQLQRIKSLENQLNQISQTLTALAKKSVIDTKNVTSTIITSTQNTTTTATSTDKYSTWKTLKDDTIGFTIKYPDAWEAKIEDGTTGPNAVVKPNTKYHYLSLKPVKVSFYGNKWILTIGIKDKDSSMLAGLRTGIAPVYQITKGETIKISGSDIVLSESSKNGIITEMFFDDYSNSNHQNIINNKYLFGGWFSYTGDLLTDSQDNFLPNQANSFTRNDQIYKDMIKILESIDFTQK